MFFSKLHPNTKIAYRLIFATLLMVVAVVTVINIAMPATTDSARIAFASYDGNDFEIFTVNPDGSGLRQLTDNAVDDWGATWSPDHTQLAFRSGIGAESAIYIMDLDTNNIQRVSAPQMRVGNPYYQGTMTWSPDGAYLAYDADFNGNWDIWTSRISDGQLTRLTNSISEDLHPDWSPDGTQIVFNRTDENGFLQIFMMNSNGTNITQLSNAHAATVMYPRWSPNGDDIVFFINESSSAADLYMMDASGENIRQITTDLAVDRVAVFSPDGESLVFRSERDGDSDIYTLNLNTGKINPVTRNHTMDMSPDW